MAADNTEHSNRTIAFIAIVFGVIALILVCTGLGTAKWESVYVDTGSGTYALGSTANFFYTCSFTNGSYNNCTTRSGNLTNYPRYSSTVPWMTDYNLRMQNAAGLCIVGILFLFLGLVMIGLMMFIRLEFYWNFLAPIFIFFACLLMLAGLAEGSRYLLYNDYSANLYQAGHLFTIFTLFLSTIVASRIHLIRVKDEEEREKAKQMKTPVVK